MLKKVDLYFKRYMFYYIMQEDDVIFVLLLLWYRKFCEVTANKLGVVADFCKKLIGFLDSAFGDVYSCYSTTQFGEGSKIASFATTNFQNTTFWS